MKTLLDNQGTVFAAVDEFCTFLDSLDSKSQGNAERARYLSLWSGVAWQKITKTLGSEIIHNPRFQFTSFLQNYFLMDMMLNSNQFDGFLPRFLVSTPQEVFVPLREKMNTHFDDSDVPMQDILDLIHSHFFSHGKTFDLSPEALVLFEQFHDVFVMEGRQNDRFDDKKSMILSKAIGNTLRISGIQAALRMASQAIHIGDDMSDSCTIIALDMERAITIVKYSVGCLTTLVDSLDKSYSCAAATKRSIGAMPESEVIDKDFIIIHRAKVQKIFQSSTKPVEFSQITKNHWYPQLGGKSGSGAANAKKFVEGLQRNGLGKLETVDGKLVFTLVDIENASLHMLEFLKALGVVDDGAPHHS